MAHTPMRLVVRTRWRESELPCHVTNVVACHATSDKLLRPDTRDSGGVAVAAGLSFATVVRTGASPAGGGLKNHVVDVDSLIDYLSPGRTHQGNLSGTNSGKTE